MAPDVFIKYPRTRHIVELVDKQGGLNELIQPWQYLVIEEKMDGTQVGISLDSSNMLQIQSRGQFVSSEPEFSLLKNWCWQYIDKLSKLLGNRYILFGEWLFAKHTMFYDCLPSYLMEFDIYDRGSDVFLSTKARRELLVGFDFIDSVSVLDIKQECYLSELKNLIGHSSFTSEVAFEQLSENEIAHTDTTGLMEGLYIKLENDHEVLGRYKLIRPEFIEKITSGNTHWKSRSITRNMVRT